MKADNTKKHKVGDTVYFANAFGASPSYFKGEVTKVTPSFYFIKVNGLGVKRKGHKNVFATKDECLLQILFKAEVHMNVIGFSLRDIVSYYMELEEKFPEKFI